VDLINSISLYVQKEYLSVVTELAAGRPGLDSRQRWGFFILVTASRWSVWPTQTPIKMGTAYYFARGKAVGAWSWLHLYQVPRLRMRGVILPLPHTSSWRG